MISTGTLTELIHLIGRMFKIDDHTQLLYLCFLKNHLIFTLFYTVINFLRKCFSSFLKVTIRASVAPLQSGSSVTPSISASTSTLQLSPPRTENVTAKNHVKLNTSTPNTTISDPSKTNEIKSNGSKSKNRSKVSNMQKKQSTLSNSNKKSKVNTALRNLR